MALSKSAVILASTLFQQRPDTIPGTRAILDDSSAAKWHERVTNEMKRLEVTDPEDVTAFCDLAGVAD